MRIFETRAFGRFARKERIGDGILRDAVERAEQGLIDADLGGHVIKQRVARPGEGRSGGYRTLISYKTKTRAVFVFGFAKNDQDNISSEELKQLRKAAAEMLSWNDDEVEKMLTSRKWREIEGDD